MEKPAISQFNVLADLLIQKYERYLPTAFDDSLTMLEKVNKIIEYLNQMGKITNDIVVQWNTVMEWVMNDGLSSEVDEKIDSMVSDGTFDTIINQNVFNSLDTRVSQNTSNVALKADKYDFDVVSRTTVDNGKQSGRKVHIYQWGSPFGGNDWCFVRTPSNYDPKGKPHQLVILNHGNGWTMNGTEAMANFSSKTQFGVDTQNGGAYLDTARSDYVKYSSPLIEAFLAEGYVVAGAQNDGGKDSYGNRETRQNIKYFFEHLVQNFNVQDYCHMIGASNGALATLNACFEMGNKIRSVSLLYPLINLYDAWKNTHTAGVESAYGIVGGSFSSYRDRTKGHDPLRAYVDFGLLADFSDENIYANTDRYNLVQDATTKDLTVSRTMTFVDSSIPTDTGKGLNELLFFRKTNFPFPRIRGIYSMQDTVLPQNKHWLAFKKLLSRSLTLNYEIQVQGEHGDYTHFEGLDGSGVSGLVAWTKL